MEQQLAKRGQLVAFGTIHLIYYYARAVFLVVLPMVYLRGSPHVDEARNGLLLGCREQYAAAHTGQQLQQGHHLVLEAHLKTLVELVNDEPFNSLGIDVSLAEVVGNASGSGKDDVWLPSAKLAVLVHSGSAAIESHATQGALHGLQHLSRL